MPHFIMLPRAETAVTVPLHGREIAAWGCQKPGAALTLEYMDTGARFVIEANGAVQATLQSQSAHVPNLVALKRDALAVLKDQHFLTGRDPAAVKAMTSVVSHLAPAGHRPTLAHGR